MDWLMDNGFLLLVLLVCIGMHVFGHKHGGHGSHEHKGNHEHGNDPDWRK